MALSQGIRARAHLSVPEELTVADLQLNNRVVRGAMANLSEDINVHQNVQLLIQDNVKHLRKSSEQNS